MNLISTTLIRLSSDTITLSKAQQQTNLYGSITIYNVADVKVAVKIKSNNPSQYVVAPSQVFLTPSQKAKINFTKNINSLSKISLKADKFQFLAVEIDASQIQIKNNLPKVDDAIFMQKDRRSQKEILEVQMGSDYNSSMTGSNLNGLNNQNHGESYSKLKSSPSSQVQMRNPQMRISNQSNTGNGGWGISSTTDLQKIQKNINSQFQSMIKHPMSPQFPKGQIHDKDKIYKQEYERLIQKVHEQEKNFQQLDQEIKITKNEKEKWNQIQSVGKIKEKNSSGYEFWHVILVILIFMFIGTLWAK